MGSRGSEEWAPLRHAGAVLLGVGLFVLALSLIWNRSSASAGAPHAVAVEGLLTRAYVEQVNSRTSIDEFIIMEVEREGVAERWVLPVFSKPLAARIDHLETGQLVTALLEPEGKVARWSGDSLRVAWSIEQAGRQIIPESQIREAEASQREFSPMIGISLMAFGMLLLLLGTRAAKAVDRPPRVDASATGAESDHSLS